jgi:hypothetical protein
MKRITNLKLEVADNISLNMGAFNSSLELLQQNNGNYTIKIITNDVSEVILSYEDQIKIAHCELPISGSSEIEDLCFRIKEIRREGEYIVMDLSLPETVPLK